MLFAVLSLAGIPLLGVGIRSFHDLAELLAGCPYSAVLTDAPYRELFDAHGFRAVTVQWNDVEDGQRDSRILIRKRDLPDSGTIPIVVVRKRHIKHDVLSHDRVRMMNQGEEILTRPQHQKQIALCIARALAAGLTGLLLIFLFGIYPLFLL